MKIAFVILQYKAVEETKKCVDSIRKFIDTDEYSIIIVDNNSPDDSYDVICRYCGESKDVVILKSNENLGFAKGNNLGFMYAKNTLHAQFIAMINNDTALFQSGFYETIKHKYDECKYAVMGPMIVTNDGSITSNPLGTKDTYRNENDVNKLIKLNKIRIFMAKTRLIHIYELFKKIKSKKENNAEMYSHDWFNIRLHGAAWIFSPEYIEKFDGLDSRTFMYGEEMFLQLHVLKNNMKMLYSPELVIFHKEDASTDSTLGKTTKKRLFIYENNIKSETLYLEALKEYSEKKI